MNTEDTLLSLQLFYSQGRRGNSNTRETPSEDPFLKQMYVETNLDRNLLSDILSNKYHLVVITGNPGDGKTAFLKRLEEKGVNAQDRPNGKIFKVQKYPIEINYDGSQDHQDIDNQTILKEFFSPVENAIGSSKAIDHTRVIAINEGRLLQHLNLREGSKPLYPKLRVIVENQLEMKNGSNSLDGTVVVIDLNKRSVVARRSNDNSSILEDIIMRMSEEKWWTSCNSCEVREYCPVNINISSMKRQKIRDRFRELIRIASFWGKMHITIRDTLSALSFILFGESSCEDIRKILTEKNEGWEKWVVDQIYFNSILNGSPKDRILSTTSLFEIYRFPGAPHLDADAFFGLPSKIANNYVYEKDNSEMLRILRILDRLSFYTEDGKKSKYHYESLKNMLFFEGIEDIHQNLMPVKHYISFKNDILIDVLGNLRFDDFKVRNQIIRSLNKSRGLDEKSNKLTVGHTEHTNGHIISYNEFDSGFFTLEVPRVEEPISHYCENEPNSLILCYTRDSSTRCSETPIRLVIDLEMYNMIRDIDTGYLPTRNELEGKFYNLGMFLEMLEELGGKEIQIFDTINKEKAQIRVTSGQRVEVN